MAWRSVARPAGGWIWLGAAAGLASFAVTAAFNIPRNNALAHLDPDAAASLQSWRLFVAQWTAANHGRAVLSLVSAAALALATRPSG